MHSTFRRDFKYSANKSFQEKQGHCLREIQHSAFSPSYSQCNVANLRMFSIRVFVDLYVAILLTCIGFGRGVHLNARNRCVGWLRYVIFLWSMVCLDDSLHFFSTFFSCQSHLFQHLTPLFHHQRSFVRVSFYICINLQ